MKLDGPQAKTFSILNYYYYYYYLFIYLFFIYLFFYREIEIEAREICVSIVQDTILVKFDGSQAKILFFIYLFIF